HRGGGARGARAVERQRRFDGGPVRDRPRGGGGGGAVARLAGVAAAVALAAGVEQQVGAALRVGDLAGYGVAGQPVGHRVGRGARVEREVDGGRAGHVRRGHRGARDGVGVRVGADPGGGDAHAGGEEVHAGPVVGEVGARVSGVGGAHGDRLGGRGGGDVARVLVLVAGGRHEDHARVDGRFDGGVDRRGVPAAEAHVRHRGAGGVVAHPFDAVDDARVGAVAGAVEDADADEGDLLGDAVFGAADGACDVGAVAVAVLGVRVAVDEVVSGADAAGELAVGGADAGVHDVGGDAGAVAEVFVGVVEGQVGLVDAVQAPRGRVVLDVGDADGAVLFDEGHLVVGGDLRGFGLAHLGEVAVDGVEAVDDVGVVFARHGGELALHDDDVLACDGVRVLGAEDGGCRVGLGARGAQRDRGESGGSGQGRRRDPADRDSGG